jgi:hypothetical protein
LPALQLDAVIASAIFKDIAVPHSSSTGRRQQQLLLLQQQDYMDFVSFLPGDNQDLAAAQVIELINQDLGQLLRLPPQQFWQVVVTDKSLHTCLDSFLRFRR